MQSSAHTDVPRNGIVSPLGPWSAPTREVLPLTPPMIAVLESEAASARSGNRGCAIIAVAVAAFLILLSLVHVIGWDLVVVAVCSLFGVPAVLELTKGSEESYSADIDDGTYIRLRGPTYLRTVEHEENSTDYYVWVNNEEFPIGQQAFEDLRQVAWVCIGYAPYSRTVFALQDASGKVVLRHCRMPEAQFTHPTRYIQL